MNRAKFKPDCFKDFPLHRAAASGSVVECTQLLSSGANLYQPTSDGWTALHAAIANREESVVELLLKRYEEDWTIAQQTIRHQFLWKVEQVGWKNRPVLIAWTDEDCEATVAVASNCPAAIPLSSQVFVLLRNPHHGHCFVALDVCNRTKWCEILRLIRKRLLVNGVLSLDRSDMRRDIENYLLLACTFSTKEIVAKLISKGASLSFVSGGSSRTPFIAAVESMRKDVIDLLFSKYSDRFDPFACDRYHYNALHLMLYNQRTGMVDFLMKHLLHYRMTKWRETKLVALGKILHFKSTDAPTLTIWYHVRSPQVKKVCEKYIRECGIDLSTPLDKTTTLADLIAHRVALQYCFEQIEQNLSLLEWQDDYSGLKILHVLIARKQLAFVETLYHKHGPRVKAIFEIEEPEKEAPAFALFRQSLHGGEEHLIRFVWKHHREFYMKDVAKLREMAVVQHYFSNPTYGKMLGVIEELVPELREDIEVIRRWKESQETGSDCYEHMRNLCDSFNKTAAKLESNGKKLDDYLDRDGRTFLHVAASWGNKSLVEKLLSSNMDVMKLDANGCLPIHLTYRCESLFELFLSRQKEEQLAYVNPAGYNLLHICCKNGLYGDALQQLIDHGMDVNGPAPDGQLPLSLASCCGTVTFLLDHGARTDLLNEELLSDSLTHMRVCAAIKLIERVSHLPWFRKCAHIYLPWMLKCRNTFRWESKEYLEKRPDIRRMLFDSLYEHSKEQTAELFTLVCHNGTLNCVQWFMEYGYDIDYDYLHWDRSTPLMALLTYIDGDVKEQFVVIEKLLEKPIDVNAKDEWGHNGLIKLVRSFKSLTGYCDCELLIGMVSMLLKRGVRVDEQDNEGNTALHYAFESEQWELVECLIGNGVNVRIKNGAGMLASSMGSDMSRCLYGFMQ